MTASGHWRPGRTSGKSGHVRYAADADWIRELGRQQGAWANIPLKRNRKDLILPVCGMVGIGAKAGLLGFALSDFIH